MIPLQYETISMNGNNNNLREMQLNLFPEEMGQTKGAATVMTQAKQANEHNEKQGYVCNSNRNEGERFARSVYNPAAELVRVPLHVCLEMK
jgi:hypothetical protein